ncbi:hypothetical protein C2845_PM07G12960 [Panicum miliaceum]|uniref:Uncharacterized protein n=1 Tax=Panicum miliaceum TaxID=4540 RepID=A0A3L6SRD5_PANMI|nr:hypothetical protein C2845_PM07G12960 [Panicum miliaceum]
MDGTHHPVHQVAVHITRNSKFKNVAVAAMGKGTGKPQVQSGVPIFVPREERNARPRNSPSRPEAMGSPAAVAVAAPGKEAWVPRIGDSPDPSGRRIFVPHPRQQQHDTRPAGIDPVSPREASPSGPAFEDPPAYLGGPDQRPTPATPATSAAGGSSNGTTTDSEEEDQLPVAAAKGEGEANATAGRSPPAAARATGDAASNGSDAPAALENLPSVAARQSIPNTPAMDARPSPAAARPKPRTSVASDNDQRKETTFCERLLSCFGLCS